jgi:hypothetical protein
VHHRAVATADKPCSSSCSKGWYDCPKVEADPDFQNFRTYTPQIGKCVSDRARARKNPRKMRRIIRGVAQRSLRQSGSTGGNGGFDDSTELAECRELSRTVTEVKGKERSLVEAYASTLPWNSNQSSKLLSPTASCGAEGSSGSPFAPRMPFRSSSV